MADETLNIGPDEVNAAEPEVTEPPAGDSPPEAAVPEPEQAEPAEPGMEGPSAGEPPGEGHEPGAPGDTPPQEVDTPEAEQPEVAGAVVEDAPTQEPLPGDGHAAEEPETPAPGDEGEVVVPFDKISELIAKRNQEARAAIEQEEAATPQLDGTDKGTEEPAQEEPAPKRRGRPPKEKKPGHEEKTDKPRRGHKPKEAAQNRGTPEGKPRDKRSRAPQHTAENLLDRDFHADRPNEKWLTDVTEFHYHVGPSVRKLYLSAILDLCDRRIVAFALRDTNDTALVHDTLDRAIAENPDAHPLFHSDRGFQYTTKIFRDKLAAAGMIQSMSRVGKCIDNGPMEGFWGILKRERYYGRHFTSREALADMIRSYVGYYNSRRLQRRLGVRTPLEVHALFAA